MDTFDETLSQTTSPRRAGGMTDDTWGPWIEHTPGQPCPIPDLKEGEYQILFRDRVIPDYYREWTWGEDGDGTITRYRLRKPSVDWEALAREAVRELLPFAKGAIDVSNTAVIGVTRDNIRSSRAFLARARKAGVE